MYTRARDAAGYDVTPLLKRTTANYPACAGLRGKFATSDDCSAGQAGLPACPLGDLTSANLQTHLIFNTTRKVGYAWEDLADGKYPNMIVSTAHSVEAHSSRSSWARLTLCPHPKCRSSMGSC